MSSEKEKIGMIGIGYVGLVTATCLAELGNRVVCMDIDAGKIESLKNGEIPIFEPGLAELIEKNRGRLDFTTALEDVFKQCEIVFIAVDTPPTFTGDADLSRVFAVMSSLPGMPDGHHILVMKSTVPVGTGLKISSELARQEMVNIDYVSNPEFLREGSAIHDFLNPDRVVIGSRDPEIGEGGGEGHAVPVLENELGQFRLIDGDLPFLQCLDLLGVDIHADDVVSQFRQAGSGDQADIADADHADAGFVCVTHTGLKDVAS